MIELPDAAKARGEGDLAHRQRTAVDQRPGKMRSSSLGDLHGRNSEMALEEAAEMPFPEADARRERFAPAVVERAVLDQAQRPRHDGRRTVPRRCSG